MVLSLALAAAITEFTKVTVGRPRPGACPRSSVASGVPSSQRACTADLISRCIPKPGSVDPSPWGLSNSTICTQTDHYIMTDGWRSFPSGHSSRTPSVLRAHEHQFLTVAAFTVSFAGLGFLAFYIAGKLHLFDKRGCAVSSPRHSPSPAPRPGTDKCMTRPA